VIAHSGAEKFNLFSRNRAHTWLKICLDSLSRKANSYALMHEMLKIWLIGSVNASMYKLLRKYN
jgi:hypothetical protein